MQKIPDNTIGLRIMLTRKRLGITQKDIAKKANIPIYTYRKLERGLNIQNSYEYVNKIKKVMGIDFDDPELVAIVEKLRPEGCQQPSVDDNQLSLFGEAS